ncbi:MAG: hypothetical protein AAGF67_11325, partial [Verrucomicrobiota bacterium]
EREVMKRTGAIGDSESPNLQPLRDNYLEKVEEIESSKSDKEADLNKIYVGELQRLQKELTVAGKIDEALKAKAIAEKLNSDNEETAAVANTSTTSSASPWPVPEPTPEVLEGGKFLKPVVFPEGRHRLRSKIQIGERDPVKPGKVYFSEGTEISCTDEGEIYIIAGVGRAHKTVFNTARIEGGLVGDWEFVSCVFDRTTFRKGDTWRGRPHASQWKFDDCKISGDFFSEWTTKDVGYQIERTTFERVEFLDLEYHDPADKVAQKEWLIMRNCRFENCSIPLSVLISTVDCVFVDCSFRDDEKALKLSGEISVDVFAKDCNSRLREVPDKVKLEIRDAGEFSGSAGSSF